MPGSQFPFILGIDQGSSHTRAAVCDYAGKILARGRAPGACHQIHGMPRAMETVQEAAQIALEGAGLAGQQAAVLFGGLTGADWPDEYTLLEANLRQLNLAERVHVVNDCIIALRGGTRASYGAIVIAGTGGNCAIRSPDGREYIYHFYMEEELQGGSAIGRAALTAIYRSASGREPATLLTETVLAELGYSSAEQMLREHVEGRLSYDRLKDLAPRVIAAAEAGDEVALKILRRFGAGLAELITAGLQSFDMTSLEVEVVLSGSVFKGGGKILEGVMAEAIHPVAPRAQLVNARYEPVVGALLLGLEKLGISTGEALLQNIEASCQHLGLLRLQA